MNESMGEKKDILETYERVLKIIEEKNASVVGFIRASDFLKTARLALADRYPFLGQSQLNFTEDLLLQREPYLDEVSREELRSAYELLIKRFFDTFSAFTW